MAMRADMESPAFWAASWEKHRSRFFLSQSQESLADGWLDFYNQAGQDLLAWHCMGDPGPRLADFLFQSSLVQKGQALLEIGCGSGSLSLAAARKGAQVLALDQAEQMIDALMARAEGMKNLQTRVARFEEFESETSFDLVLAAFFPPALCPEGIARLERWADRHVALILGAGTPSLPFRGELWERLMEVPLPSGRFHLLHLIGYLITSGRKPNLRHLVLTEQMDRPAEDLIRFFCYYFEIFKKGDPQTHARIREYFCSQASNGRIQRRFSSELAVVWWDIRK